MPVTLDDILAARTRIASGIYHSPCPESVPLSEITGAQIYCKLDYLQRTGSFKERGARNALLLLDEKQRSQGVIAASAGNHALGLAYHGGLLGIAVTVVMPRFAPLIKVTTCRRLNANVVLHGETFGEARAHAVELGQRDGLTYIHGFNDAAIIAGQGTLGLEILEQVPDVEAVVVPVGGGGLIAGVAVAIKAINPSVRVYGVEPEHAAGFTAALAAGRPTEIQLQPTLADGLAVGKVGDRAFALAAPLVDGVVTVSEDELTVAVLRLVELEKSVVEGAGAAPLAACMSGKLPQLAGRRTVLVLAGGNIDPMILSRVIERGLVDDGRLCRFTAVIKDRPGGLAHFAELVARSEASIQEITHDRAFSGPNVSSADVECTVETSDRAHLNRLFDTLRSAGISVMAADGPASGTAAGSAKGAVTFKTAGSDAQAARRQ